VDDGRTEAPEPVGPGGFLGCCARSIGRAAKSEQIVGHLVLSFFTWRLLISTLPVLLSRRSRTHQKDSPRCLAAVLGRTRLGLAANPTGRFTSCKPSAPNRPIWTFHQPLARRPPVFKRSCCRLGLVAGLARTTTAGRTLWDRAGSHCWQRPAAHWPDSRRTSALRRRPSSPRSPRC